MKPGLAKFLDNFCIMGSAINTAVGIQERDWVPIVIGIAGIIMSVLFPFYKGDDNELQ